MTTDEAKTHFTKLAQDAGLDKDQTAAVLQAMENEKFRTNVSAGYKRHEDYSREMDTVRNEKQRLKDWYEKEELPKYQTYTAGLQRLAEYQKLYGDLEGDDGQGLNNGGNGAGAGARRNAAAGMSKEDIDKYVEEKLKQRDGAYIGLTKTAVRISTDYTRRFNDTLDLDALEKLALERGLPLDQAYTLFIAPKEQAATEERHKAEIEKAKAEAIRDYQSRNHIPFDTKAREAHPYFDRKAPETGKSDLDVDRGSKEAFMAGWNEYEGEITQQKNGS